MIYKTKYQQYQEYLTNGGTMSFLEWQNDARVDPGLLPPAGSMLKDSFWAEIETRWPGEFDQFSKWIDEYKKRVNWLLLFNSFSEYQNADGKNAPAPKFHDLPPAMQIGIFLQYCIEERSSHRYDFLPDQPDSMEKLINMVPEWFCEEYEDAVRDHQEGKFMDGFN